MWDNILTGRVEKVAKTLPVLVQSTIMSSNTENTAGIGGNNTSTGNALSLIHI